MRRKGVGLSGNVSGDIYGLTADRIRLAGNPGQGGGIETPDSPREEKENQEAVVPHVKYIGGLESAH
jgi:hypothetical protein